jgi:hypothetical protein
VFSLNPSFRRGLLRNICAIGLLDSLAILHQAAHSLSQFLDERRRIVLFDGINRNEQRIERIELSRAKAQPASHRGNYGASLWRRAIPLCASSGTAPAFRFA